MMVWWLDSCASRSKITYTEDFRMHSRVGNHWSWKGLLEICLVQAQNHGPGFGWLQGWTLGSYCSFIICSRTLHGLLLLGSSVFQVFCWWCFFACVFVGWFLMLKVLLPILQNFPVRSCSTGKSMLIFTLLSRLKLSLKIAVDLML